MILRIVNKADVMTLDHIVRIFEAILKITFLLGSSAVLISLATMISCVIILMIQDIKENNRKH